MRAYLSKSYALRFQGARELSLDASLRLLCMRHMRNCENLHAIVLQCCQINRLSIIMKITTSHWQVYIAIIGTAIAAAVGWYYIRAIDDLRAVMLSFVDIRINENAAGAVLPNNAVSIINYGTQSIVVTRFSFFLAEEKFDFARSFNKLCKKQYGNYQNQSDLINIINYPVNLKPGESKVMPEEVSKNNRIDAYIKRSAETLTISACGVFEIVMPSSKKIILGNVIMGAVDTRDGSFSLGNDNATSLYFHLGTIFN
jgi:hypothetical protein